MMDMRRFVTGRVNGLSTKGLIIFEQPQINPADAKILKRISP
jgi:hypothetical protein